MTNCNSCGVPLSDEDAFCPNCGAATGKPRIQAPKTVMDMEPAPVFFRPESVQQPVVQQPVAQQPMVQPVAQPVLRQESMDEWQRQAAMKIRNQNRGYVTAIKVMLIIACIAGATAYLIPLLWMVPMTVVAWKKLDRAEPLGLAFKIFTCIFVSKLAGFFMFMLKDDCPGYV
jgi:hypothetical protein